MQCVSKLSINQEALSASKTLTRCRQHVTVKAIVTPAQSPATETLQVLQQNDPNVKIQPCY